LRAEQADKLRVVFATEYQLDAGHVGGRWTFFAVHDIKGQLVADLEFVKRYALEFFRVKEEVLGFAIASNKAEAFARERLDCSFHIKFFRLDFLQKLDLHSASQNMTFLLLS
jgi:hypothetical protein